MGIFQLYLKNFKFNTKFSSVLENLVLYSWEHQLNRRVGPDHLLSYILLVPFSIIFHIHVNLNHYTGV